MRQQWSRGEITWNQEQLQQTVSSADVNNHYNKNMKPPTADWLTDAALDQDFITASLHQVNYINHNMHESVAYRNYNGEIRQLDVSHVHNHVRLSPYVPIYILNNKQSTNKHLHSN